MLGIEVNKTLLALARTRVCLPACLPVYLSVLSLSLKKNQLKKSKLDSQVLLALKELSACYEKTFFKKFDLREREREREGGGERERQTLILLFHLCIRWLILVYALIGLQPATLAYWDDALTN